jgi:hypothetical protein
VLHALPISTFLIILIIPVEEFRLWSPALFTITFCNVKDESKAQEMIANNTSTRNQIKHWNEQKETN